MTNIADGAVRNLRPARDERRAAGTHARLAVGLDAAAVWARIAIDCNKSADPRSAGGVWARLATQRYFGSWAGKFKQ
jgi:hypothetical protein